MGNKLSDGFAGADTRKFDDINREVESRLGQDDLFQKEFSGKGAKELGPGMNPTKRDAPFEDPKGQYQGSSEHQKNDAEILLGELESLIRQEEPNPYDQFDGTHEARYPAGDNQKYDPNQTDPNLIIEEDQDDDDQGEADDENKKFSNLGPDRFHKEVENRMKKLGAGAELIKSFKIYSDTVNIYRDKGILGGNSYSYKINNDSSQSNGGFNSVDQAMQDAENHLFWRYK